MMGALLHSGDIYHQTVGALQYVTLTRPNMAFFVNKLCQFMHCRTDVHWQAIKHLLLYLKGTTSHGLKYVHSNSLQILCFTNSD